MELYTLHGVCAVAQAHNQAVGCFGGNFQFAGQRVALDDQTVIAVGLEGRRQVVQHALAAMIDQRSLAVHRLRRADYASSVDLTDSLVAQTDAQQRNTWPEALDDLAGKSGLVRRAG